MRYQSAPQVIPEREPAFDHGAALRVPPAHDTRGWQNLLVWLGEAGGRMSAPGGMVQVRTAAGVMVASSGDWIVLSVTGDYHVAHAAARSWDG